MAAVLGAPLFFGCGPLTSDDATMGLSGEWCTYRTLGANGLPIQELPFIGMTLVREGNRVLGTGTTKRAGDTVVWPSRYRGDVTADRVVIDVSYLEGSGLEGPGPLFTLDLRGEGSHELVGTAQGDEGLNGPVRMVRVSALCFRD